MPSWQNLVAEEKVGSITAAILKTSKCMSFLIIMLASFCHQYVFPSTEVGGEPGPLSLSSKKSFICLEPELRKSQGWHCFLSSGSHSKTSPVYGRSIKTPGTVDLLRFPRASLKLYRDFQICVTLEERLHLHSSTPRMGLTVQGMCSSRDMQQIRG